MPPRRRDRVEDVYDCDNLRHLEQRLDQLDQRNQQRDQRLDRMVEQLTQQMAALLENQNRRNLNPNSDPDREKIEYDSNSEGDATLFSEENPSDEAFFYSGRRWRAQVRRGGGDCDRNWDWGNGDDNYIYQGIAGFW
ncbi:hypothetical protein CRG98_017782 [Punica granatum]|uniref:Uncharacterized protein n=1 Tax=Punica granatum TaxID=22663 RepID=A0A2I0JZS8_PUNGR|nr:hypothetical protein CRG98_017782 [Punica granatum]